MNVSVIIQSRGCSFETLCTLLDTHTRSPGYGTAGLCKAVPDFFSVEYYSNTKLP
jgi:hypothetical protein